MSEESGFIPKFRAEVVGRILITVSSGLTIVFLARQLSPTDYGLLFLSISIFTMASLLGEFGIAASAARYVTEFVEKDPAQVPHIITKSVTYSVVLLSTVSICVFVFRDFLAEVMGEPALSPLLLWGGLFVFFAGLKEYPRRLFQAFHRIRIGAAVHALQGVSQLVFVVLLVLAGFGVSGALFGYVASYVLSVSVGFAVLYFWFYRSFDRAREPVSNLRKRIVEYSVPIFFTKSGDSIIKQLDVILIGYFLTPGAAGLYTAGKQVITFTQLPAGALGYTVSSAYGKYKSNDQQRKAAAVYEETVTYTLLFYLPATAGLILVAEPTVEYLFGREYVEATPVLQVLSVFMLLQAITKITSGGLDYIGRASTRAKVKGISALGNLCLNVVLIPTFGIVGAALATVVTYGFYTFANVWIMATEITFRPRYVLRQLLSIAGITGVMVAVLLVTTSYITGLATLFGVVFLGVITWGALTMATGLVEVHQVSSIIK